jgi:tRNA pseudouridine65 synthase
VIGDTQRGDGEHNRLIRHHWNIQRLWLHALAIQLEHPSGSGPLKIRAPFPADWHQAFDVFGICPFTR